MFIQFTFSFVKVKWLFLISSLWHWTVFILDIKLLIDFKTGLSRNENITRRVAVYLGTHCNVGSKRAFPTGVLDRWHNCLFIILGLLTHRLFCSCIWRYPVSRSCDWVMPALYAVLRIFSYQFSLLFSHVGSQGGAAAYLIYPISDIGRCRKCGKYVPCTRRTIQWNDFELILAVIW